MAEYVETEEIRSLLKAWMKVASIRDNVCTAPAVPLQDLEEMKMLNRKEIYDYR